MCTTNLRITVKRDLFTLIIVEADGNVCCVVSQSCDCSLTFIYTNGVNLIFVCAISIKLNVCVWEFIIFTS